MTLRYVTASMLAAMAMLALPAIASAQKCEGSKPKGGKWTASGELYIDRAMRSAKPQDKRKRYQQAVDILTEGFAEQSENPRNYLMAGEAYVGLRDYSAANDVWVKAEEMWSCYSAKLDTLRYNAWVGAFNRGVRYSNAGEMEKALKEYTDAYIIYDKQPQPYIQLAGYYAQAAQATSGEERDELNQKAIGYFREAIAAIDRAIRLRPEERQRLSQAAVFNLGQVLAFNDLYEEAAKMYQEFLEREPDNIDARTNAGVVLTLAADQLQDEAEGLEEGARKQELLDRAASMETAASEQYAYLVAREDLTADNYHNIGAGLSRIGKDDKAIKAFGKALELAPYRANSLEQLAHALFVLQQYDSLKTVATILVERYPLNLNNLALLANAYRELEQPEKALEILQRREAMALELLSLNLTGDQGSYAVTGYLNNLKLDAGTAVDLQFDLYDDAGELAVSTTIMVEAPQQGAQAPFEAVAESSSVLSGFTYRLADSGQAGGN